MEKYFNILYMKLFFGSDILVRNRIAYNMALLTLSGVVAKTIDFSFRAYYSRHLGAEGMGIYSLIMSVFGMVLSLSSAGMGVAVSRLVSLKEEQGDENGATSVVRTAVFIVFCIGAVCVSAIFVFAEWVAEFVLKDSRCTTGLLCIAPASVFMGISYCIKGYFYGIRKVIIPASSEFVEQAVKVVSISFFLNKGLYLGAEYGCAGVLFGIMIGEMCSCLYLFLWFWKVARGGDGEKSPVKIILEMTVPMTASAVGNSFFRMVEDVWIIDGLKIYGEKNALGVYGLIKGMTIPLLVFPLNLISSFMALLVPEVSRAEENGGLCRIVKKVGKTGMFFGFLAFTVFFIFAEELSSAVYGTKDASEYIKIFAILCPVMVIDSLSNGMLGGLGEQRKLLQYGLSDTALRLIMIYFLLPYWGDSIIILMTFLSNFLTCWLNQRTVKARSGRFIAIKDVLRSGLCALAVIFTVTLFLNASPDGVYLILSVVGTAVIFTVYYIVSEKFI